MVAQTIKLLAELDPSYRSIRRQASRKAVPRKFVPWAGGSLDWFKHLYYNVGFGWYIATKFAQHDKKIPVPLLGRDRWVFLAQMMRRNPDRHYNPYVAEAYHIAHFARKHANLGEMLKALIMSVGATTTVEDHLRELASTTNIDYHTLEAFEVLFYNVLDRREDGAYIAAEIYPNTRLEELDPDYYDGCPAATLLKRAGYNNRDLDLTTYLMGIGDHTFMSKMAASDDREAQLSKFIMGNGLLLTKANLMNQRSVGMSRAHNLLAASRHGGQTVEEPALGGIAPLFGDAYARAINLSEKEMIRQVRVDAGERILDI